MWPLSRGTGPLRKLQERLHWWGTREGLESQLVVRVRTKPPTKQGFYTQPWLAELELLNCSCFRSLLVPKPGGGIKFRLQLGTQRLGTDSRQIFFSHSHILCSCSLIQQLLIEHLQSGRHGCSHCGYGKTDKIICLHEPYLLISGANNEQDTYIDMEVWQELFTVTWYRVTGWLLRSGSKGRPLKEVSSGERIQLVHSSKVRMS